MLSAVKSVQQTMSRRKGIPCKWRKMSSNGILIWTPLSKRDDNPYQGKRIGEKFINGELIVIIVYTYQKSWQQAVIMMAELENSHAHVDDSKNLCNAHMINKS